MGRPVFEFIRRVLTANHSTLATQVNAPKLRKTFRLWLLQVGSPGVDVLQKMEMVIIDLKTQIDAPIDRVFDLARSIDAHTASAMGTKEMAVAGRVSGLIDIGERVTWEARHFGVKQKLTVKVTRLERPNLFEDEMIQGAFSAMKHLHVFEAQGGSTMMKDRFEFSAPFGLLGRIAERLFLKDYMTRFITNRNRILKNLAESDEWKRFLTEAEQIEDGNAEKPAGDERA